jgi:hypothetical protein
MLSTAALIKRDFAITRKPDNLDWEEFHTELKHLVVGLGLYEANSYSDTKDEPGILIWFLSKTNVDPPRAVADWSRYSPEAPQAILNCAIAILDGTSFAHCSAIVADGMHGS